MSDGLLYIIIHRGLSDLTHVVANRAVPRVRIQLDQDGLSYTEFYHLVCIILFRLSHSLLL